MKSVPFLSETREIIPIEFHRLQRLAVGLRSQGLFADGRSEDLTFNQIAHMVRLMCVNPYPKGEDFIEIINQHQQLISQDGRRFIEDLAGILENYGLIQNKDGMVAVQRISFSLDRPFVVITFEDTDQEPESLIKEKNLHIQYNHKTGLKTHRSEITYGSGEAQSFERFAVLKRSAIQQLAIKMMALNETTINDYR